MIFVFLSLIPLIVLFHSTFTHFPAKNNFILLYDWIILWHTYISQFLYLPTHWEHLVWFYTLTFANSASINMSLQGSLLHADFDSFQYIYERWNSWVVDALPYLCRGQAHTTFCFHLSYFYSSVICRAWALAFQLQQCLRIAFWSRDFNMSINDKKK